MNTPSILDTVFYGPLKATIDPRTGVLGPILDRATGTPASLIYRSEYLSRASRCMLETWACTVESV